MKTFLFILFLFSPQAGKQYEILKRCWNDDCEKFNAVVTITTHEVLFFCKNKPNATLKIHHSMDLKGKQYHMLQGDTLINDTLFITYRGAVVIDQNSKTINIEVRTPESYHFVKYLFK